MEWILIWRNRLPLSSKRLLMMQPAIYYGTLLPIPHVILTYTTLCLFTTVKTWSTKHSGWSMHEKLNYKYALGSEPTPHDVMLLHFAPLLSYGLYCLVKWNNKVTGYNKTKVEKHSETQNVMGSTYIDGFTVNTTAQVTCNSQKQKWNKYDNYIYHWSWQILTANVCHSTLDVHKFIGEQTKFWILRST